MWAAEHGIDEVAAALADPLAEQLLLRGQLAEAQRRYEQAARHSPPGHQRVRLLRDFARRNRGGPGDRQRRPPAVERSDHRGAGDRGATTPLRNAGPGW